MPISFQPQFISDVYSPGKTALSIEVFPPKTPKGIDRLKERLKSFKSFSPEFISVTYGAGGSTQSHTIDIARYIQEELEITAMSHLTCVGQSREDISHTLEEIHEAGIKNIMALRGDPPKGEGTFKPHPDGFSYGNELIAHIAQTQSFAIGCAGYPESHIESVSIHKDIDYLKMKLEAGASFIVTQFFLDNDYFYRFRDLLVRNGIKTPLVAGILPISNYNQINSFALMCGCTIPAKIMRGLYGKSDEDQEKFGLEHAAQQTEDLLKNCPDGIHLYALNKRSAVERLAPLVQGKAR